MQEVYILWGRDDLDSTGEWYLYDTLFYPDANELRDAYKHYGFTLIRIEKLWRHV